MRAPRSSCGLPLLVHPTPRRAPPANDGENLLVFSLLGEIAMQSVLGDTGIDEADQTCCAPALLGGSRAKC